MVEIVFALSDRFVAVALDLIQTVRNASRQSLVGGDINPSQGTRGMKLNDSQVDQVLDQLPAEVIPDDHPTVAELESVFGPHTFFIGPEGLHVVERGGDADAEQATYVVKVAHWSDTRKNSLVPQNAEVTDTIDLDTPGRPDMSV